MSDGSLMFAALVFFVTGFAGTFFGYKIFKLFLAFVGFVAGFFFVQTVLGTTASWAITIAVIVGLIAAILSYFVYKFAFFSALAYLGSVAGAWLMKVVFKIDDANFLSAIGALLGIAVGIITLIWKLDKTVIAIMTSIIGAYFILTSVTLLNEVTVGLQKLLGLELTTIQPETITRIKFASGQVMNLISSSLTYTFIFILLAVGGCFFQLRKRS